MSNRVHVPMKYSVNFKEIERGNHLWWPSCCQVWMRDIVPPDFL